MFRLRSDKAVRLLENSKFIEKTKETHYIFGRNDVFSFEEDGSIFSIIERPNQDILVHDYERMGDTEREVSEIDKDEASSFLKKTGHDPFMRFDITRHLIEKDDEKIVVEKVDQLGYFVNDSEIGSEEVSYGELLKSQMINDTEKEKRVREGAQEILPSS